MTDFEEYIRQVEPGKKEKGIIWQTAIGLQQVDGLKPSAYLLEMARQNIEGDISFDEVKRRIDAYYKKHPAKDDDDRTEEADKVSARIAEVLSEKTFSFTPIEYLNIHKRLFSGIYKFAGKIRDYNITKSEWVLDGETVLYAHANMLKETLEYDFKQEKIFNYKDLSEQQITEHIARYNRVELSGRADKLHGGVVHIHMRKRNIRVFFSEPYSRFPPKPRGLKDVCLINGAKPARALFGHFKGQLQDPLDLMHGIDFGVEGGVFAVIRFSAPWPEIDAACELTHY